MNIFVLDDNPERAAQMMCDKHVVKMILESKDLLQIGLYRTIGVPAIANLRLKRHWSHPCSKWAAASWANWDWLRRHGVELCREYTFRYEKTHRYDFYFRCLTSEPALWPSQDLTPYVQCMFPEYKTTDAVAAYRNYYLGAKHHLLSYTRREIPDWIQAAGLGVQK